MKEDGGVRGRKFVITGATGLIGSALLERLEREGGEVTALVRNPERDRSRLPGNPGLLPWKATATEGEWCGAVASADVIINLAGAPLARRWDEKARREIYESRVIGTRNIVEAMSSERSQLLINGSAVGYYGGMVRTPVDESAPPGENYPATVTVEWEREASQATARGARVVLLRTGIVLSPKGGALKELLTPFRLMVGGPIGSGDQPWPWIHIDDEIGLIMHAISNREVVGPLNLVAPESIDNATFAKTLGRVLGRPAILPTPRFVMRAILGDAAMIVTEGQNAQPVKALETGYQFRFPHLDGALEDLLR